MKANFHRTKVLVAAIAAIVIVPVISFANPWSEKVIDTHVDQSTITGTLPLDVLDQLRKKGERLFTGRFTEADGVGRPFATQAIIPTKRKRAPENGFFRTAGMDSNACSGCHNEPVAGGAGDFVTNVFVSEGFESADFDSLDPQFSNERGSNHIFGAGLVELLAREMTAELRSIRRQAAAEARKTGQPVTAPLVTKGVEFGAIIAAPDGVIDLSRVEGVDADLVIRPFSQKGVMTSLRQFTDNALNQHHGMQPSERFGDTLDRYARPRRRQPRGRDLRRRCFGAGRLAGDVAGADRRRRPPIPPGGKRRPGAARHFRRSVARPATCRPCPSPR